MTVRNNTIASDLIRFTALLVVIGVVEYLILAVMALPVGAQLAVQIVIGVILMASLVRIGYKIWLYSQQKYHSYDRNGTLPGIDRY